MLLHGLFFINKISLIPLINSSFFRKRWNAYFESPSHENNIYYSPFINGLH